MLPAIVRPIAAAATTGLFSLGGWVVAQAAVLENPLELVAGSVLMTAAVVSLALILKASRFERESASTIVERLDARVETLERDLLRERDRSARLLLAYDNERRLRLSLEDAGVHDRRHHDPADERRFVSETDYLDLDVAQETEELEDREDRESDG